MARENSLWCLKFYTYKNQQQQQQLNLGLMYKLSLNLFFYILRLPTRYCMNNNPQF